MRNREFTLLSPWALEAVVLLEAAIAELKALASQLPLLAPSHVQAQPPSKLTRTINLHAKQRRLHQMQLLLLQRCHFSVSSGQIILKISNIESNQYKSKSITYVNIITCKFEYK